MTVDDFDLFEENGYSYSVGIRSIFMDRLELIAEVGQVDIDYIFDKELRYMAGAYYSVTENIVLGANYTSVDDFNTLKATFRYQF